MIELNRNLAPISEMAWERIEAEARTILELHLAARRLVDFEGPLGWAHSAIDLGQVKKLEGGTSSASGMVRQRLVRPLIELRFNFELDREQIEAIDRGASSVDLDPLRDAAREFAVAEDSAIFEGYADAEIPGLITDSTNPGVALPQESSGYPAAVGEALEQLRQAGVSGPYAIALGPDAYAALNRRSGEMAYPILRHVERLIDGPVVWAPSLRGAVVVSLRGGDFRFVCGRDVAIGYSSHDENKVSLYLEESFSAELSGPEASVPLLSE